jgi:hypothetical protein
MTAADVSDALVEGEECPDRVAASAAAEGRDNARRHRDRAPSTGYRYSPTENPGDAH